MTVLHDKAAVSPNLVGRANEIQALHLFIDDAKNGHRQTIFLSGEAGVGKSRLVAEAMSYAATQGFLHLQGICFQPDIAHPYAPFQDLLHTSFLQDRQDQSNILVQEREMLISELGSSNITDIAYPDPEQRREHLYSRLKQFFTHLTQQRSLMLVIEDIHWCDDVSLGFLYHLARQSIEQPIILLLTYRDEEKSSTLRYWRAQFDRTNLVQEIILERLNFNEVSAMLRAIFVATQAVSPEFVSTIYTLTDGNPFFIEEVLKSLINAGDLSYQNGAWSRKPVNELSIPRSIQDAVQGRFEQLSATTRHVMRLAAVIGRRFDFELLQNLTQLDEQQLLNVVKELVGSQLVSEEAPDQFTFRHALTRQAIYRGLLSRECKKLHQQIVETIESRTTHSSEPFEADLAYHAYEAGDWIRALKYSLIAGEQAQVFYAPQTAIEHFMRGQHSAEQLSITPPSRFYHSRGLAYEAIGEFQRARADLETALHLSQTANDHQAEWQLLIDLGKLWTSQDYEQTGQYYQRAFELARLTNDQKTLGHSLNRVGNWHLNVEHPADAHWYHQEALKIFEKLDDKRGIAETLDLLGMASYLGGNLIQGTEYYQRAIVLFNELEDRRGLVSSLATLTMRGPTYQTDTLNAAGPLTEASKDGEVALQIARETGQRADEVYSLIFMSICLGAQGAYPQAFGFAHRAFTMAAEIDHHQWIVASNFALGAVYLDILAHEAAQQYLERALSLARHSGSLHWMNSSAGLLALVYVEQRHFERAESLLSQTLDPAIPIRTLGHRLIWRARVELALFKADAQKALQGIERLGDSLSEPSGESTGIRLLKLRGEALTLLGQYTEAETAFQSAHDLALAYGARPLQWRIGLSLARLHHSQKHYRQADQYLKEAQIVVDELAAGIPERPLAAVFKQNAMALMGQPLKVETGGLTQRECEVAVLIAQGKSNRQIAESLVLGERTVETHVGNILSKLDFASRSQVAAWVVEHGLVC